MGSSSAADDLQLVKVLQWFFAAHLLMILCTTIQHQVFLGDLYSLIISWRQLRKTSKDCSAVHGRDGRDGR